MEHPNAVRFRNAFDDLSERGDLEPTIRLLRDDAVWVNDIGAGPFHRGEGKESVIAPFAERMAPFDGDFGYELYTAPATTTWSRSSTRSARRAGQRFDNLALYRYELDDDGLVTHVRTYDRDREAIEAFWAAVGDPVR